MHDSTVSVYNQAREDSVASKRWVGTLLGTILLGAVGSGVWQSILGPGVHIASRWLLDIASLGLKTYKNSVYEQVAMDNPTRPAVETLFVVTLILLWIYVIVLFYMFYRQEAVTQKTERLARELSGEHEQKDPTFEQMKQEIADARRTLTKIRRTLYVITVALALFCINHMVVEARFSYVSSATGHYHQVLRLASPYLNASEHAQVESDFAQIDSRDDYIRVLSQLEGRCKANGRNAPSFDPW